MLLNILFLFCMYWFKIKENGYEYSIYSQNYMINNEYRKYTIRILYTYLQPKNQNICDGDGAVQVGLFYCWWLVSVWTLLLVGWLVGWFLVHPLS